MLRQTGQAITCIGAAAGALTPCAMGALIGRAMAACGTAQGVFTSWSGTVVRDKGGDSAGGGNGGANPAKGNSGSPIKGAVPEGPEVTGYPAAWLPKICGAPAGAGKETFGGTGLGVAMEYSTGRCSNAAANSSLTTCA